MAFGSFLPNMASQGTTGLSPYVMHFKWYIFFQQDTYTSIITEN